MNPNRSLLFHGLGLTLRRFPAVLWAFAFNLIYSAITTFNIANSIGGVTDTSLAAQPLRHGFDIGTIAALMLKLSDGPGLSPSTGASVLLYLATYFLLVPGTLLCYQTGAPAKLSTLLQAGLLHFWRFVRITLLALIVSGIVLGVFGAIYSKYTGYLDDHILGLAGFVANAVGILVLALVAAVLRLYFDLVEVYTVQLGLHLRPSGKPDRRVRKTLLPALRALRGNFGRAYGTFVLLAALGLAAITVFTRATFHSLAQTHVLPMFAFTQLGLFLLLMTRFWQRGAETTLSLNQPILEKPVVRTTFMPRDPQPVPPTIVPLADPIPAPEPATPSLAEPDPGVFHHEVSESDPKLN